jgi:hypothetical protein
LEQIAFGEKHMRIAQLVLARGLGILLVLPAGAVFAQSAASQSETQASQDPIAAAAKRAHDDKKDQAKPARVWDNDNIPKAGQEISVIGQKEDATDNASADAAAGATAGAANVAAPASANGGPERAAKNAGNLQAQIDGAKEKLASLRTDLELMQRTLVLDSQMYYGKPDYSNDTEGARKLQDEQAQIAEKQQAIDEAEKQIAELEGQLKDSPQTDNPPINHD